MTSFSLHCVSLNIKALFFVANPYKIHFLILNKTRNQKKLLCCLFLLSSVLTAIYTYLHYKIYTSSSQDLNSGNCCFQLPSLLIRLTPPTHCFLELQGSSSCADSTCTTTEVQEVLLTLKHTKYFPLFLNF